MDISENSKDVDELLRSSYIKPKVKKYENLFLARKVRRQRDTSDLGQWIKDVLRKKMSDINEIKGYIETKYSKKPSESVQKILSLLGRTKVSNNKVVISDNFANKPLYFFVNYDNMDFNVFSNDDLFLGYLYKRVYDYYSTTYPDSDILPYMSDGVICKVYFVSKPFIYDGDVKKGYYQDFQSNFAAIGVEFFKQEDSKNKLMLPSSRNFEFTYKGIRYAAYAAPGPIVMICKANNNIDLEKAELESGYSQLRVFNKTKDVVLGLKEIKVGKKSIKYLDIRVKPENFCPNFLILDKQIRCNLIYKMKFDLNQLFEDLDKAYLAKGGFAFYKNSCYWDTIESWYDFLAIYAMTSKKISENDKKILTGYIGLYHEYKSILLIWQKEQLFLQKTYKLFFSSFVNHIDKYKLKKVGDNLKLYIDDIDYIKAEQEDYSNIKNFLTATSIYNMMMYKQFDDSVMKIPNVMLEAVKDLEKGRNIDTLPDRFRQIAQSLYQISLSSTNDPTFPLVFAQGAFLGDLKGGLKSVDPLKTMIETYYDKEVKSEKSVAEMQKIYMDIAANMDTYIAEVVKTNVMNYLATKKIALNTENLSIVTKSVLDSIYNDSNLLNSLKAEITKCKVNGTPIKDLALKSELITKWVEIYVATHQRNVLVDKINAEKDKLSEVEAKKNALLSSVSAPPESVPASVAPTTANPPSRKTGSNFLIDIKTNIDKGEEFKVPGDLSISYDPLSYTALFGKVGKVEKKPEKAELSGGATPGGDVSFGATPGGGVSFGTTPGGDVSLGATPGEVSEGVSPAGIDLSMGNINIIGNIQEKIDEMDIESSDLGAKKYKESFVKDEEESKEKKTNPFAEKKVSKSKKYIKSKPKRSNPFHEKKLKVSESKDTLIKSQIDLELEKINKRQREYNKIKTLREQEQDYDYDSFVSQDFGKESMNNRTSILQDVIKLNPQKDMNYYINSRKLPIDKNKMTRLVIFYSALLNFMREFASIPVIPKNLTKFLSNIGNVINRIKYLYQNFPISDSFLNNIASESSEFLTVKEVENYIKDGKARKGIISYNPKNIITRTIVQDLMNEEYKHWPIYKPPAEAKEEHLSYSKQGLSASGTEPENADDLDEVE